MFDPAAPSPDECPFAVVHSLIDSILRQQFGLNLCLEPTGVTLQLPDLEGVRRVAPAHYLMSAEAYKAEVKRQADIARVVRERRKTKLYIAVIGPEDDVRAML